MEESYLPQGRKRRCGGNEGRSKIESGSKGRERHFGYLGLEEDPMADLSFPLRPSSPVFLKASTQATLALNFSELTGVNSLNEAIGSNQRSMEPSLIVEVPGAARSVKIPNQIMLREVFQRLNLTLKGAGIVVEDSDVYCAWLEIEIPSSIMQGPIQAEKLYGQGRDTKYAAIESVCATALMHLHKNHDVVIEDFWFAKVKTVEAEIAESNQWSSMLQDFLQLERKRNAALKKQQQETMESVAGICYEFSDVLPIRISYMEVETGGGSHAGVVYDGQEPPTTRMEKLAAALVSLAKKKV